MHELKIRLCLVATGVYIYKVLRQVQQEHFIDVRTLKTPGLEKMIDA